MYKKKARHKQSVAKGVLGNREKDGQMANIINIRRHIEIIAAYIKKKKQRKTNKLVNISIIKDET